MCQRWRPRYCRNPRLVALCRSLSPALLRVGGSTSNLLMFSEKNRSQPVPNEDWMNNILYPEHRGPLVIYGKALEEAM